MPAQKGLWPHDHHGLEDRGAPTIKLDEEQAIAVGDPNWRGVNRRGSPRINQENDFVRIEIETALEETFPLCRSSLAVR